MKKVHAGLYPKVIREVKLAIPDIKIHGLLSLQYIEGQAAEMVQLRKTGFLDFLMTDTSTFTSNVITNKPMPRSRFGEHCQYSKLFAPNFDIIPAFDEDFDDPEMNQVLLERMIIRLNPNDDDEGRALVAKIMPVVHSSKGALDEFQYYHELGFNYIALGSKPAPGKKEIKKIQEYRYKHDIKVHLFGRCGFDDIKDFAPDSVDSSNFAMSVAYNTLMLYWNMDDVLNPTMVEVTFKNNPAPKSTNEVYREDRHGEYLRQAGFTFGYNELIHDISKRHAVNIYSYWLMEKWLTDVWAAQHRAKYVPAA